MLSQTGVKEPQIFAVVVVVVVVYIADADSVGLAEMVAVQVDVVVHKF